MSSLLRSCDGSGLPPDPASGLPFSASPPPPFSLATLALSACSLRWLYSTTPLLATTEAGAHAGGGGTQGE
eukprot:77065-Chlamydomonas_euryale.AAC.1